jgi:hypothetical protein
MASAIAGQYQYVDSLPVESADRLTTGSRSVPVTEREIAPGHFTARLRHAELAAAGDL